MMTAARALTFTICLPVPSYITCRQRPEQHCVQTLSLEGMQRSKGTHRDAEQQRLTEEIETKCGCRKNEHKLWW